MRSIDKSVRLYRSSTLLTHGRQSVTTTVEDSTADHTRAEQSVRQSWEDESLIRRGQSGIVSFVKVGTDERHDSQLFFACCAPNGSHQQGRGRQQCRQNVIVAPERRE